MRFKPVLLFAPIAGFVLSAWGGTPMAQVQKPGATIAIAQAGGDGMEVTVVANGAGVSYFGGVFLEFGDGKRQLICRGGQGCRETRTLHRYAQAGRFEVRMVGLGEPDQKPLAVATVVIPMK